MKTRIGNVFLKKGSRDVWFEISQIRRKHIEHCVVEGSSNKEDVYNSVSYDSVEL